eukprot:c9917_g1_i1 orf=185-355(+)
MADVGYVPDALSVLYDAVHVHSEKWAIAFGFISTSPRTPLCSIKGLRASSDCYVTS